MRNFSSPMCLNYRSPRHVHRRIRQLQTNAKLFLCYTIGYCNYFKIMAERNFMKFCKPRPYASDMQAACYKNKQQQTNALAYLTEPLAKFRYIFVLCENTNTEIFCYRNCLRKLKKKETETVIVVDIFKIYLHLCFDDESIRILLKRKKCSL